MRSGLEGVAVMVGHRPRRPVCGLQVVSAISVSCASSVRLTFPDRRRPAAAGCTGEAMTVTYASLSNMWDQVILPRVGDVYVFGGSLSPTGSEAGHRLHRGLLRGQRGPDLRSSDELAAPVLDRHLRRSPARPGRTVRQLLSTSTGSASPTPAMRRRRCGDLLGPTAARRHPGSHGVRSPGD